MRRTTALAAAFALSASLISSSLSPVQASKVEPAASAYDTSDYIALQLFTADYGKRLVTLRYKVLKPLPISNSRIELVVRNLHASAPQLLQISDAKLRVGSTFSLSYAVSTAVPIDMLEASATLLTPLPSGVLQRSTKLSTFAMYAPARQLSARAQISSAQVRSKAFNIPVGSLLSLEGTILNNSRVSLRGVIAENANQGLNEDNLTSSAIYNCGLSAGTYLEMTSAFVRKSDSVTGINLAIEIKAWTSPQRTKRACPDFRASLSYLS